MRITHFFAKTYLDKSYLILCGTAVSLFLEMTKYHQFVNMTDYFFLRYSIVIQMVQLL